MLKNKRNNLMSLAISFHFLCAQHVSDINISIIRSLRLFCWINTLVVLFLVRCVLEFRCGWVGVISVLQAEFHFLCAQHVSDINISIIRSLRLFCWITTLVVLFLVRCALEFRCGWVGVISVLQAEFHFLLLNMFRTLIYPSSEACDYSVELPHWSYCSWFDVCWSWRTIWPMW